MIRKNSSQNNKAGLKMEMIVNLFTVIGVIAAISFAGYNAHYLHRDFILRNRPYVTIEPALAAKSFSEIFGVAFNEKEQFIWMGKDDHGNAVIYSLVELRNVGRTPAKIDNFKISISEHGLETKKKKEIYTYELLNEQERTPQEVRYIIFPDEKVAIPIREKIEPEGIKPESKEYKKKMDEICKSLEQKMNADFLYFNMTVKYYMYDEEEKEKYYYTRKAWIINPKQQEEISVYHSDIE